MLKTAGTDGREIDLAWIGLCVGNEFGDGFYRKILIDLHHHRRAHHACDRRQVFLRVETQLAGIERLVDGDRRRRVEQGIAICRRPYDEFAGEIAAGARAVVDDDRLAEPLRQPLPEQAGIDVGGRAGCETGDDVDWPRRKSFSGCGARKHRECGSAGGEL